MVELAVAGGLANGDQLKAILHQNQLWTHGSHLEIQGATLWRPREKQLYYHPTTKEPRLTRRQRDAQAACGIQNPGHEVKDFKVCSAAMVIAG